MTAPKSVLPWSYSSWNNYQTCPRQFYELKIAKNFQQDETEAIKWGNFVHKAAEEYLRDGVALPSTVQRMAPQFDAYRKLSGDKHVEVELAVDKFLKPTGFWDDNAFIRGKGDYVIINGSGGAAVDWKTGKVKPSGQIRLMGLLTMCNYGTVDKLTNIFHWTQAPTKPTVEVITRADLPKILKEFIPGVQDMLYSQKNNAWPEKPSGLCRNYCPVKSCRYYQKGARYVR
jgi:hypothetical protein